MKNINLDKELEQRKKLKDNPNIYYKLSSDNQIPLINKLYFDISFNEKNIIVKELLHKYHGYKNQDIDKEIYDKDTFITFENIIEKLLCSKLKCYYCNAKLLILYENIREPLQWTLDRINNNLDHSNENTVISCLKCNLQRRCKNIDKFKFTKQLKIIRKD